jgi:hypothetical protein
MSVTSKGCLVSAVLLVADLSGCVLCNENLIYVFPEKELCGLSPNFQIHVSVRDLYFPRIGPQIFLQQNRQSDCGKIYIAHRHMNVEIESEAEQFLFWEYLFQILGIESLQCVVLTNEIVHIKYDFTSYSISASSTFHIKFSNPCAIFVLFGFRHLPYFVAFVLSFPFFLSYLSLLFPFFPYFPSFLPYLLFLLIYPRLRSSLSVLSFLSTFPTFPSCFPSFLSFPSFLPYLLFLLIYYDSVHLFPTFPSFPPVLFFSSFLFFPFFASILFFPILSFPHSFLLFLFFHFLLFCLSRFPPFSLFSSPFVSSLCIYLACYLNYGRAFAKAN